MQEESHLSLQGLHPKRFLRTFLGRSAQRPGRAQAIDLGAFVAQLGQNFIGVRAVARPGTGRRRFGGE